MLPTDHPQLTQTIRQQCADGYGHYDQGDFKAALRVFYQAWLTLPKPQTDYPEAGWVLTAIGDSYFRLEQYQPGREALQSALCCPGTERSAFTHLRLGQCLWELGQLGEGRAALYHAHELSQTDVFASEDTKYRQAVQDLLP